MPVETVDTAPYNYEPEGRMFESCRAHHTISVLRGPGVFFHLLPADALTVRCSLPDMEVADPNFSLAGGYFLNSALRRFHSGQAWSDALDLEIDRRDEGRAYVLPWDVDFGFGPTRHDRNVHRHATRPKHEALNDLAEDIAEHTGKLAKQGESIVTFAELWKALCAVKSGQRSKKTRENLKCLFAKHVIPQVGSQRMRNVTLTPLQLLLNKLAEDGFRKSAVGQIRTYMKGCFEYAVDEDLIPKSPARKLVMPKVRKKPCERFLSVEEFRALLSDAPPREHVILRIFAVCGLRPAESEVARAPGKDRVQDFLHQPAPRLRPRLVPPNSHPRRKWRF